MKKIREIVQKFDSNKSDVLIRIKDTALTSNILNAFGDTDKKNILTASTQNSKAISEFMNELGMPQTSCYRKANELIKDGFLIIDKNTTNADEIKKYRSLFKEVKIYINKNKIILDLLVSDEDVQTSEFLRIARG